MRDAGFCTTLQGLPGSAAKGTEWKDPGFWNPINIISTAGKKNSNVKHSWTSLGTVQTTGIISLRGALGTEVARVPSKSELHIEKSKQKQTSLDFKTLRRKDSFSLGENE